MACGRTIISSFGPGILTLGESIWLHRGWQRYLPYSVRIRPSLSSIVQQAIPQQPVVREKLRVVQKERAVVNPEWLLRISEERAVLRGTITAHAGEREPL